MKFYFFIILLFFLTKSVSSNQIENYVCELLMNKNTINSAMLIDSTPKILQISYIPKSNILVDFRLDGKSVIDSFHAIELSSSSIILEIWRKGYGRTFSKEDIENGIYFELYASDLVAHWYQQFVPGIDYQCKKY